MNPPEQPDITRLLVAWREGDSAALDQLAPLVYDHLHRLASSYLREERRAFLQTTELVHEAYLRLVDADVDWDSRRHFYVVAARQMRRVLVDQARRRAAHKRDGGGEPITLDEAQPAAGPRVDVLALDEALAELATLDERKARVIELSYFAGLTIPEIAQTLDISSATVERDLRNARAWLAKSLRHEGSPSAQDPS